MLLYSFLFCEKFQLLWVILIGLFFALIIQSLAANLGVVTGTETTYIQFTLTAEKSVLFVYQCIFIYIWFTCIGPVRYNYFRETSSRDMQERISDIHQILSMASCWVGSYCSRYTRRFVASLYITSIIFFNSLA